MSLPSAERDLAALVDMLSASRRIATFIVGLDRETFLTDLRTQDAVVRRLEVIGEAANRLTPECREANPEIPWAGLIGLRNVLAHQYDRVDYDIVWQIVTETVPTLALVLGQQIAQPSD